MARDLEHILNEGVRAERVILWWWWHVQYLSNEGESAEEVLLWKWSQTFISTSRWSYSIV